jgi:DNA-binding beta-propeller fold protein YncE
MRPPAFFLTFLLALTACTTPAGNLPATPSPLLQTGSTTVLIAPTLIPTEVAAKATFETSLLATEWKGRSEDILLFPLDPAGGTVLPGYTPVSLGQTYFYAFSPDRRTLAVMISPSDYAFNGDLLLIDLAAWKTRKVELKLHGWVRAMVFSPDGRRLAISYGDNNSTLAIFDLEQGVIAAQEQMDSVITRLKFTTDGEALMLYGAAIQNDFTANEMVGGSPQVSLLDAADLSLRWSARLEGVRDGIFPKDEKATPTAAQMDFQAMYYLSPGVVFAPDREVLYVVHADSEQLTTVDFDAQKYETMEIRAKLSWFERLLSLTAGVAHAKVADGTSKSVVVSPDGHFLYIVGVHYESSQDLQGNSQISQTPLGLEVIQTSNGSRMAHLETEASDLSISPDGRFIYLRNWISGDDQFSVPWTAVFDTSSCQILTHKTGIYASPALRINGEPLLVSTYSLTETLNRMSVSQLEDLSVLTEWTSPDYIAWLTPQ